MGATELCEHLCVFYSYFDVKILRKNTIDVDTSVEGIISMSVSTVLQAKMTLFLSIDCWRMFIFRTNLSNLMALCCDGNVHWTWIFYVHVIFNYRSFCTSVENEGAVVPFSNVIIEFFFFFLHFSHGHLNTLLALPWF